MIDIGRLNRIVAIGEPCFASSASIRAFQSNVVVCAHGIDLEGDGLSFLFAVFNELLLIVRIEPRCSAQIRFLGNLVQIRRPEIGGACCFPVAEYLLDS